MDNLIIKNIRKLFGIKRHIYIFDFDTTLTTHDIGDANIININIFRRNVRKNFEKFVLSQKKNNNHVIILSYNTKSIILKSLHTLLHKSTINEIPIITPEIYGLTYDDIKDNKLNMKQVYIDGLIKLHEIDADQITFYDNDLANITYTSQLGINTVLVTTDDDLKFN